MTMRHEFALRPEHRLALAPKMLQSIEVLQLATADLVRRIENEVQANEVLDVQWRDPSPPPRPVRDEDGDRPFGGRRYGDEDAKLAFLHSIAAEEADLEDHVRRQLAILDIDVELQRSVMRLVEHLDERGWLTLDDQELADLCGAHLVEAAREVLQELEPKGLGARGPVEAMLAQIPPTDPDRPVIAALLTKWLGSLARNRLPEVASALDLDVADVERLLARIARLEPRPAQAFRSERDQAVRPDVVVRHEDGELRVVVEDQELPVLLVDREYAAMAQSRDTPRDVRRYLRDKLRSARELIRAVDQRRTTLARVGAAIFRRQAAFLEQGTAAIVPLKMSDIAAELGLHTSTVSRAIAGKWVQTDAGVLPLRSFFDGARGRAASGRGEGTGRLGVKARIREILAAEESAAPLSDEDVVARLRECGIPVARRTVAKYRRELGIPSSWRRRRFGGGRP